MHITMVDVVSLDGKITQGSTAETHSWASAEDWDEFVRLRGEHEVLIMGITTYEVAAATPDSSLLRIVLTHHPEKHAAASVPGQLEFVSATPQALVSRLANNGYRKVMVAGGSQVNADFLAAGLVTDIYLTFEPVLFGQGTLLATGGSLETKLQLQSVRKLNKRGTLLAHYTVRQAS